MKIVTLRNGQNGVKTSLHFLRRVVCIKQAKFFHEKSLYDIQKFATASHWWRI